MGEQLALVANEQTQELELGRCQRYRLPSKGHQPPFEVDDDAAVAQQVFGLEGVDGAAVHASYALRTTADGGVEADADALVERTLRLLDALAVQAPAAFGAVRAVGASAFWHSVLGVDAAGQAITPLLLWADARAHTAARELQASLDERAASEHD